MVDQICGSGHIVKGVAEGKVNPCDLCGQSFDERTEIFLTVWLRQLLPEVEDGTDILYRQN